jgi:hypothetical protein
MSSFEDTVLESWWTSVQDEIKGLSDHVNPMNELYKGYVEYHGMLQTLGDPVKKHVFRGFLRKKGWQKN